MIPIQFNVAFCIVAGIVVALIMRFTVLQSKLNNEIAKTQKINEQQMIEDLNVLLGERVLH